MKHNVIIGQVLNRLSKDKRVTGILLMGSVANCTALPTSDLDLLIICDDNKFETEIIDDIMVEFIYRTYERASYKLNENSMDLYHYLDSKVLYDSDGKLKALIRIAMDKFECFNSNPKDKKAAYHWLLSTKIKLQNSIYSKDIIRVNFFTATNSWKLIEAIWLINNIPIPPSSTVILNIKLLKTIPDDKWFDKLFIGGDLQKAKTMVDYIEWALPLLI